MSERRIEHGDGYYIEFGVPEFAIEFHAVCDVVILRLRRSEEVVTLRPEQAMKLAQALQQTVTDLREAQGLVEGVS